MKRVQVELKDSSYEVLVGSGAIENLADIIGGLDGLAPSRAAVVSSKNVPVSIDPGLSSEIFYIDEGEDFKNLQSIEKLCGQFSRYGLSRDDLVIAVGGGLVTDLAGFAASVYHRGLACIYVPTTLLGQVDAAIGGKTGVNLAEGKNLVGTFSQPLAVLCDTAVLKSLPEREYLCGLGEVAKYHFIVDHLGLDVQLADMSLDEIVAACVEIKAKVVSEDENDRGERAILNYGHTLAHALEIAGSFDLRHGEAVAVGLVYAAELARLLGRIDQGRVQQHREVLNSYGLPVSLPSEHKSLDAASLISLMNRDKKARQEIRFVLEGPNGMEQVEVSNAKHLKEALEAVR